MGGLRHTRNSRTGRHERPARTRGIARVRRGVALLCAATALFGALLICLGPAPASASGGGPHAAAPSPAPVYNCPYEQGHCGVFPHLSPAILTAPSQDAPPEALALPVRRADGTAPAGVRRGDGAWPRAPGPHVLQVLRR
ncbi:hypothetical protein ACFYVL_19915 [Streptomyces sp. NPDC004111]|uniref:hypothetical protein n=1 Tax=Streptomyces sp. NPDC004111 TaxID=3364690 RepID=UPI00369DE8BF